MSWDPSHVPFPQSPPTEVGMESLSKILTGSSGDEWVLGETIGVLPLCLARIGTPLSFVCHRKVCSCESESCSEHAHWRARRDQVCQALNADERRLVASRDFDHEVAETSAHPAIRRLYGGRGAAVHRVGARTWRRPVWFGCWLLSLALTELSVPPDLIAARIQLAEDEGAQLLLSHSLFPCSVPA